MTAASTPAHTERGFALLIVLWTMVVLALLGSQLAAAGRGESRLAANLRGAAIAQAAADGAVHEALFHLLDNSNRHWRADGAARTIKLPDARVDLRIQSEAGKINPNAAPPELLQALLHATGTDTRTAATVALAIADWRFPDAQSAARRAGYRAAGRAYEPPGAPFETIDELGLVLGMTPGMLARLAPELSLHWDGEPDPHVADRMVARAMQEATGLPPQPTGGPAEDSVVRITAAATGPDGSRFVRRAVARLGGHSEGRPYRILAWHSGDS